MPSRPLEISAATFSEWIDGLARFSAAGPGVTRRVYDDAWCDAHCWLRERAASLGLATSVDGAGNLFFHPPKFAAGDDRPVLMVGSHLDSVVQGGRYDGAYGTLAGLAIAAERIDTPGMPVVGFVTCEEEDSRFHAGFMGARSLLGRVEPRELDDATDTAGMTWRAALETARARDCAAPLARGAQPFRPLFRPALMLELHIEQGPVLETEALPLGIVDRIAGYRRLNARIEGEARHAGTTPMARRRDALAAAAEMALAAEACAIAKGAPAVATAGNLSAQPGLANVVAGVCDLTLEVRHVVPAALEALDADLRARCAEIAKRRGVRLAITERSRQEPTELSAPLAAEAEALARAQGIAFKRMASGAAHDAMIFARAGVPALMVFVPSRGGVSHSPEEHTDAKALAVGLRFGATLAAGLAVAPPVVAGGAV